MTTSTSGGWLHRIHVALFALALLCIPALSSAQAILSVTIAPPPLPVYAQPIAPGPGYLWTPGYWAYSPAGYYWVPGTWVLAPYQGALWTPGYWGWAGGVYLWHAGYWGPRVGYYGGINYGYGYTGSGYHGGYWRGNAFYYNQAVNHVNPAVIHNTYRQNVTNVTVNRMSYNGGAGGIRVQPTAVERTYMGQQHAAPTASQLQHQQAAANNRANFASVNNGRPAIAATPQPGAFEHPGATSARGAPPHSNMRAQTAPVGGPGGAPNAQMHLQGGPPQGHAGHPQGMAGGPQGHPQGGPPPGHPQGHPQGMAGGPQGHPQGHPQGMAGGPQGHPQGGPPPGHPQGGPHGEGGGEGHHEK